MNAIGSCVRQSGLVLGWIRSRADDPVGDIADGDRVAAVGRLGPVQADVKIRRGIHRGHWTL